MQLFPSRTIAWYTGKMFIVRTAAFLIGIRGVGFAGLISVFASATAIASFTMTQQMGGDAPLYAAAATVQTVAAVITIPLVLYLVGQLAAG